MKPRLPAGDTSDDRKAIRKELIETKAKVGKLIDAHADKILKKPRKEPPTSVPALQVAARNRTAESSRHASVEVASRGN